MMRVFFLCLILTVSHCTYASSSAKSKASSNSDVIQDIEEQVFGYMTHQFVGALNWLHSLVEYNNTRFIGQHKTRQIEFVSYNDSYKVSAYFPGIGSIYINPKHGMQLPAERMALVFSKDDNVYSYRYIDLPKTDSSISISVAPATTQAQRKKNHFPMRIITYPPQATVKVMNIKGRYRDGMVLKAGTYDILVQKAGYKSFRKRVHFSWKKPNLHIALQPK